MKKIFSLFLAIFVLLGLSSCSFVLNDIGCKDVSFTFRATDSYKDCKLNLNVSGSINESYSENFIEGKKDYTFTFENVPINGKIIIFAKVESKDGSILYEGESSATIKSGKNKIVLDMYAFNPIFLWSRRNNSAGFVNKYLSREIKPTDESSLGQFYWLDFDNNGNGYFTYKQSDPATDKVMKRIKGVTIFEDNAFPGSCSFACYKKGLVYYDEYTSTLKYKYLMDDGSGNYKEEQFSDPELSSYNVNKVCAIDIYGDNIYMVSNDGPIYKVLSGNIKQDTTIPLNPNKFKVFNQKEASLNLDSPLEVQDMKYVDGYLYLIVLANDNSQSRGELLKVDPDTLKVVGRLGYYTENKICNSEKLIETNFVGPRKIIGIKPKKIIIADSGCIWYDERSGKLREIKRAVTVNLDTFSFEESVNVNRYMFDGYVNACINGPDSYVVEAL